MNKSVCRNENCFNRKQLAKLLETEFDSESLWEEFQEGDENFGRP